jgi:eukaryotic-like serine/threonine-protein kinase
MRELPPEVLEGLAGRYSVERELGRGGMARVYLARDVAGGGPVALKLLHAELGSTVGADRFKREIRLAARLQHPHILRVLDSGETDGRLWFTMPLVEGETAWDRIKREHQLPPDEALRITYAAASALAYAHEQGVVHRDIKPDNILLSGDQVLVADFGVGRAVSDVAEKLTATGMIVGTPTYMSPEQASGERDLDGRTDIFALACVLYEMLAGEPPFTGPTPQAVLMRRFMGPPRALRPLVPVSEHVEQAIVRALDRDPAGRFATAADFAAALEGKPVAAAPPPPPPAGAEPAAEPGAAKPAGRRGCAAVVAFAVLLAGGAAALF